MKNFLRNRKGQGTTEYIVIMAIAVALAVGLFWNTIKGKLGARVTDIATGIETAGK